MCGLVGMAGYNLAKREHEAFFDMLIYDMVRGYDSTGLAAITPDKKVTVYKTTEDGYGFATDPRARASVRHEHTVLIGHNRSATRGKVTKANAHPFHHNQIVGAHNGTLDNAHILEKNSEFPVDSESLFYNFAHHGVKETIAKIRGAWALTWYDGTSNTINFLRNDKRPLFYGFSKDHKTLVWASEAWMIYGSIVRRGVELANGKVYSLSENNHLSWEVPTTASAEFGEPFRKRMLGAPEPTYASSYAGGYHGNNCGRGGVLWGQNNVEEPAEETAEKAGAGSSSSRPASNAGTSAGVGGGGATGTNVVPFHPTGPATPLGEKGSHIGYMGETLTKVAWDSQMDAGCAGCQSQLRADETPTWYEPTAWLCPACETGNFYTLDVTTLHETATLGCTVN